MNGKIFKTFFLGLFLFTTAIFAAGAADSAQGTESQETINRETKADFSIFMVESFTTVPQQLLAGSNATVNVRFTMPATEGRLEISGPNDFSVSPNLTWDTTRTTATANFTPPAEGVYSVQVIASHISSESSQSINVTNPIRVNGNSSGGDSSSGGCNAGAGSLLGVVVVLVGLKHRKFY